MIEGDQEKLFPNNKFIILSESTASKLFDGVSEKSIGKVVNFESFGEKKEAIVSGVFKDIPANSTLQFDYLLPFDLFVDTILSVTENQLAAVGLYPNPASRIVNLSNPQGISLDGIAIYDITGRLVQEVNPSQTGEALAIDINALTNGLYMVVLSANTSTITKRLVVSNN